MNLQAKLKDEQNIDAFKCGEGSHKLTCPQCQPPHNPRDRPLSITIENDTALWLCHHCNFSGSIKPNGNSSPPVVKIETKSIGFDSKANTFLDDYFTNRSISRDTYQAFNIFCKDNKWIGFPFNGFNNRCDNIKYRTLDKQFKQTPKAKKSLYNYAHVKDANVVIFVEGEIDVLSLWEVGFKNCTTLPDGAPATVSYKENDKRFSCLGTHPLKAQKIVLFADADGAGENLNKELIHRYGKDKCWIVVTPKDCKDANDILVKLGADALKKVVQNAEPLPVDGLYSVKSYTKDVLDLYNGNYDKPLEVGYPSLDKLYKVQKGTFHVWTGIPNHGKSTFLDQVLVNIARKHEWKFAMFSPEHSTKMHIRRLSQIVAEKPFDKGFATRMDTEELHNTLEFIHEHFYFIETREHVPNVEKILEIAGESCRKFGINGIVIDPFNEVSAIRRGNQREDEHIRDFISQCKRFARKHDCTVWVVAHPTKMQKDNSGGYAPPTAYDIAGAAHWHNQSDAVVTVHRDFDDDSVNIITRKIREQGLYGSIGEAKFEFDQSKRIFRERAFGAVDAADLPTNWTY